MKNVSPSKTGLKCIFKLYKNLGNILMPFCMFPNFLECYRLLPLSHSVVEWDNENEIENALE